MRQVSQMCFFDDQRINSLFAAARASACNPVSINSRNEDSHVDLQLEPQLQEEAPEQPQSPAIVKIDWGVVWKRFRKILFVCSEDEEERMSLIWIMQGLI